MPRTSAFAHILALLVSLVACGTPQATPVATSSASSPTPTPLPSPASPSPAARPDGVSSPIATPKLPTVVAPLVVNGERTPQIIDVPVVNLTRQSALIHSLLMPQNAIHDLALGSNEFAWVDEVRAADSMFVTQLDTGSTRLLARSFFPNGSILNLPPKISNGWTVIVDSPRGWTTAWAVRALDIHSTLSYTIISSTMGYQAPPWVASDGKHASIGFWTTSQTGGCPQGTLLVAELASKSTTVLDRGCAEAGHKWWRVGVAGPSVFAVDWSGASGADGGTLFDLASGISTTVPVLQLGVPSRMSGEFIVYERFSNDLDNVGYVGVYDRLKKSSSILKLPASYAYVELVDHWLYWRPNQSVSTPSPPLFLVDLRKPVAYEIAEGPVGMPFIDSVSVSTDAIMWATVSLTSTRDMSTQIKWRPLPP